MARWPASPIVRQFKPTRNDNITMTIYGIGPTMLNFGVEFIIILRLDSIPSG